MALKTKMFKTIAESIQNRLIKNKRCKYCTSEFSSSAEYLCHIAIHPTEVFPNLYIGNTDNAKDINLMNKIGISHILYISYSCTSSTDDFSSLYFVANKKINIITNQNITKYFNDSFQFIDCALTNIYNKYKVMILCDSNIQMPLIFVIGYLMSRGSLSLTTAYNIIKSKRNIVDISEYMKQLQIYQFKHCNINNNKKWQIMNNNKIDIFDYDDSYSDKENEERHSLIGKRSITMTTINYSDLYTNNKHDYINSNSKRIQRSRSYSSPFGALDSHIMFTNI